jgi:hypothetical protein|tara:strand:+ start:5643 stop:5819 length:177 start_codon:yes stop_codon:yes gene_type:complete
MAPFITLRRFSSFQKLLPLFKTQNIWLAIFNPKGSEFIDYQYSRLYGYNLGILNNAFK